MHYANGQQAKSGDLVYKPSSGLYGPEVIGVLMGATAGSTSCNAQLKPALVRYHSDAGVSHWEEQQSDAFWTVTVSELHPLALPHPVERPPEYPA